MIWPWALLFSIGLIAYGVRGRGRKPAARSAAAPEWKRKTRVTVTLTRGVDGEHDIQMDHDGSMSTQYLERAQMRALAIAATQSMGPEDALVVTFDVSLNYFEDSRVTFI